MNVNEWVCVPREPTEHMKNCGRTENSERGHLLSEAAYRAMLAAAPTPAPVPVDPAEIEALRRDAACFQWLMSLQSGRPESQIALAQVILAMRKNPEAVRKFIEGQIALAANGGKVA